MIKTLEEFQRIMRSNHNMIAGSIELEATFGALCKVARSANHFAARGYLRPNHHWRGELLDALEALPKWTLEEEKDPGYFFSGLTDLLGIPLKKPDAESEGEMNVDDMIRLYFRDFDLDEIFKETPEQAGKRIAAEVMKNIRKDLRRALRKAGIDVN